MKMIKAKSVQLTVVIIIAAIIAVVMIAARRDESQLLSRLDFQSIDLHNLPRKMMENSLINCVRTCVTTGQDYAICETRCLCYMNKTAQVVSREEFIAANTSLVMHQAITPETKAKMDSILSECMK